MSLSELKTSLHSAIESIDDEKLLAKYLQLLLDDVNVGKGSFTLTPEQKAAVDEARASLDSGKGIPHEVVKERLKQKYPGLIKWD